MTGWGMTSMNDLIRRHDAIEVLEWKWAGISAIEAIRELPAAQPERKTGKWVNEKCSECGQYVYHGDVRNYCPKCGARMNEDESVH